MAEAIDRGAADRTVNGKARALRWVARWSVVAGINEKTIFTLRKKR
jgi:hypothetical protein